MLADARRKQREPAAAASSALKHTASDRGDAALIRERLAQLGAEQAALEARLAEIEAKSAVAEDGPPPAAPVIALSPARDKIALFRSLFDGREGVYPKRWESAPDGSPAIVPDVSQLSRVLRMLLPQRSPRTA